MARKKKAPAGELVLDSTPASSAAIPSPRPSPTPSTKKNVESSTSALVICRNKHWRYISSFHGPWLQLPPEVLESLAHTNYFAPRPRPIDPAVFYELVRIRKCVDEAAELAVRAKSGLTSAALNNSLNAGNGMLSGAGAAALGLGYDRNGRSSKLGKESVSRMREIATQKLSQAYHLDEIAASVATMQSASTLEDVAHLVLQRKPTDVEALYVHFFHEKIPSRMMAQNTPLDPLNDIIASSPSDGSPLRTRALTKIFKEDYLGAVYDLSRGLQLATWQAQQHKEGKDQIVLARELRQEAERNHGRDWRQEAKVAEEDQPNSLEAQMLFHRAGVYFTIACQHVHDALDAYREEEQASRARKGASNEAPGEPPELTPAEKAAHRRHLEARKVVKTNAKRALRDYNAFLSHFDYTPGLPAGVAEEFLRHINARSAAHKTYHGFKATTNGKTIENATSQQHCQISDALIPFKKPNPLLNEDTNGDWPSFPPLTIYQVSQLFESVPLSNLPPYPAPTSQSLAPWAGMSGYKIDDTTAAAAAAAAFAESHESITYHPLVTDALHSLLLCHSLLQTSPKELLRHAHNAARIARICDGYPIFLAARSPARADWVEVLRRAGNWIGLEQKWEILCRPAPLPGQAGSGEVGRELAKAETETQKRERMKQEAILEALADERVVDEDSFQRAVAAREERAREDEELNAKGHTPGLHNGHDSHSYITTNGNRNGSPSPKVKKEGPKRWAQEDGKDYPISTDRAEAISRWVKEAPLVVEGSKRAKRAKARKTKTASGGLEAGVGGMNLDVEDRVEEEVDE